MRLTLLDPNNPAQAFPPLNRALREPDGLLAVGGCLSTQRLINAYRHGAFPWYNADEPILWWSPNPRLILFPDKLLVSRSLAKTLRKNTFTVSYDKAFSSVVASCAKPRKECNNTWITTDIYQAYIRLHQQGYAHSIEVWLNQELVGGLYGVVIGQVFFGESMFHTKTDASKIAFVHLVNYLKSWNYKLIDCQVHTNHLVSLGAEEIERDLFVQLLNQHCAKPASVIAWQHP